MSLISRTDLRQMAELPCAAVERSSDLRYQSCEGDPSSGQGSWGALPGNRHSLEYQPFCSCNLLQLFVK